MRTASAALAAHFSGEITTLATCWKVSQTNGTVLGFTDYVTDLAVSGVTYQAASGINPTTVSSTDQFSVDNLDVQGILNSSIITEEAIGAGVYDFAQVETFMVNAADLTQGIMLYRTGWLGEVTVKNGQFIAEVRGLAQKLQQNIGELFSPSCRAILGDSRCKVNLTAYTFTGSVIGTTSNQEFASALGQPNGYFTSGEVQWTSGENTGLAMEVKSFISGQFIFVLPLPNTITVGDSFTAITGCDKNFPTCYTKFNNAVNFRGEPYVPGMDQLLATSST